MATKTKKESPKNKYLYDGEYQTRFREALNGGGFSLLIRLIRSGRKNGKASGA